METAARLWLGGRSVWGLSMVLFSLGERLALCASMVRPQAALADVGTDHAYLPVWLAKRGAISRAVAVDIRPGPLERARRNIERYGVGGIVTARLSDGLDAVLPEEADDIVVAGMGGLLMADIVHRTAWLRDEKKRLILQPMTHGEDLRRRLLGDGFFVLREQAVLDERHVYTVMLCAYGLRERGADELFPYVGGLSPDTRENRMYLRRELRRLRNRANGLRLRGKTGRAEELFRVGERIRAMLRDGSGKG